MKRKKDGRKRRGQTRSGKTNTTGIPEIFNPFIFNDFQLKENCVMDKIVAWSRHRIVHRVIIQRWMLLPVWVDGCQGSDISKHGFFFGHAK